MTQTDSMLSILLGTYVHSIADACLPLITLTSFGIRCTINIVMMNALIQDCEGCWGQNNLFKPIEKNTCFEWLVPTPKSF